MAATSSIPNIMQLPLELFRQILKEAILVRGVKRALRLRLVNRKWLYFSTPMLGL
jgi:uncharacterized protein YjlB